MANTDRKLLKFVYNAYKSNNPIIKAEIENALGIEIEFDFDNYDIADWHAQYKFIKDTMDTKDTYGVKEVFDKYSITKEMEAALDEIGTTPMEEKELSDVFDTEDEVAISKAIEKRTGISKDGVTLLTYSVFSNKLASKIFSLTDEKGSVKTTEDTIKIGVIDSKDAKKLKDLTSSSNNEDNIYDVVYDSLKKRYNLDEDVIEWRKKVVAENVFRQLQGASSSGLVGLQ